MDFHGFDISTETCEKEIIIFFCESFKITIQGWSNVFESEGAYTMDA